jgi:dihydroneopterin aldolase/2-amino-4-hydroxy-6-hydroxymethyldihydropteridine diphosphokinase/dihydropteroate synthase
MSSFKTLISPLAPSVWKEADDKHVVAVAFGSNLGDRLANIEHALRLLEDPDILNPADTNSSSRKAYIIDTSFLYETAPMYVTDQPDFMNGACLVPDHSALSGENTHEDIRSRPTSHP